MKRNLIPKEHDPLVGRDAWADPFFALQRGINRMFEDMWRGFDVPTVFGGHRFPSIEVKDKDKELVVTAELPGLTDKDVELTLRDGVLTLKGEKNRKRITKPRPGRSRNVGTAALNGGWAWATSMRTRSRPATTTAC